MTELVIPDPRKQPVPLGWAEHEAAPAILAVEEWETLDEYEGRLRALVSYVESFSGDAVEFEKALRIVEKRRGDLLGVPERGGDRRSEEFQLSRVEVDESEATKSRWRTIAVNWDELWPLVRDATQRSQVTQAALLRAVGRGKLPEPPRVELPVHLEKLAEYASIMVRVQDLLNRAYEVLREAVDAGASPDDLVEVGGLSREDAAEFLTVNA